MNDKHYNKFIIEYLYPQYVHNNFRSKIYKPIDTTHPVFDYDLYIIFQRLLHSNNNIKICKTYIIYNYFLNIERKNKIICEFYKIQKIKNTLRKFINICKLRVYKIYNTTNICGDELGVRHIGLIENNRIYNFDLYELKKITNNSFNYMEEDIPTILNINNPYTNNQFSLHNLVNIYFYLTLNMCCPLSFTIYMKHNMNKRHFKELYNDKIIIDGINRKYENLLTQSKIFIIKRMLRYFNYHKFLIMKPKELLQYFEKKAKLYYLYENLYNNEICEDMQNIYKYKILSYLQIFENHNQYYNKKIYFGSWKKNGSMSSFYINKSIVNPFHYSNID